MKKTVTPHVGITVFYKWCDLKNGDKSPYKNIFVIILLYYHVSLFCQFLLREKKPPKELLSRTCPVSDAVNGESLRLSVPQGICCASGIADAVSDTHAGAIHQMSISRQIRLLGRGSGDAHTDIPSFVWDLQTFPHKTLEDARVSIKVFVGR